jgi:tRNA(fMet)-specific endonuclease VapC
VSFLLDTNICSAHVRRPGGLAHRLFQYGGRLYVSTIVLAELYTWVYDRPDPTRMLRAINDLVADLIVLPFDEVCAERFGMTRALLKAKGITVNPVDLQIACVALTHDLTLVTNNTAHFNRIAGLRIEDWLKQ